MKSNDAKFYKLPQILFTDSRYSQLTAAAKILYTLLADRMKLSQRSRWADKNGTYIFFTNEEICQKLNCRSEKATKALAELEGAGLIKRRRQGRNKPCRIYVAALLTPSKATEASIEEIKERLDYEWLTSQWQQDDVDRIVMLVADMLIGNATSLKIGGVTYPAPYVRERFAMLNSEHIGYVLGCMNGTTNEISNINAYLTASLFNAPKTMDSYYQAAVNHDISNA